MLKLQQLESLGRDVRDSLLRALRDYSEALFLAILVAIVFRSFVFSSYKISNLTMEPTLKLGDFVVGYRLPYGVQVPLTDHKFGSSLPKRGDIVVFQCPGKKKMSCVKRVVGLPGDRIEIRGKRLLINGRLSKYKAGPHFQLNGVSVEAKKVVVLEERPNLGAKRRILVSDQDQQNNFGVYIVPPRMFFALGDNRDFSEDSRHWGGVPVEDIESRIFMIWLSIEWLPQADGQFSSRMRWDRIFSAVD